MKCSEVLSNRVPNGIRRYTDHMKFAAYIAFPFSTFLHVHLVPFFICCMFCMLLFNFVKLYIFIAMFIYSYCYVRSVLYILFSSCQLALFSYPV